MVVDDCRKGEGVSQGEHCRIAISIKSIREVTHVALSEKDWFVSRILEIVPVFTRLALG